MSDEARELEATYDEQVPARPVGGGGLPALSMNADPAVVSAAVAACYEIQAATLMAMQNPRSTANARANIMRRCRDKKFAEKAIYKKPTGKSFITGLSIRLAEEMAVLWRNVHIAKQVIFEDDKMRKIMITVKDLEANITYTPQISIAKIVERKKAGGREIISSRKNSYDQVVFTVKATDDEMLQREEALTSKQIRNCILRLLPGDLKEDVEVELNKTREKSVSENPDAEKNKIIDAFARLNVMPAALEEYLGKPLDKAGAKDVCDLRDIYPGIKDGETTIEECIEARTGGKAAKKKERKKAPLDGLKAGDKTTHTPVQEPLATDDIYGDKGAEKKEDLFDDKAGK